MGKISIRQSAGTVEGLPTNVCNAPDAVQRAGDLHGCCVLDQGERCDGAFGRLLGWMEVCHGRRDFRRVGLLPQEFVAGWVHAAIMRRRSDRQQHRWTSMLLGLIAVAKPGHAQNTDRVIICQLTVNDQIASRTSPQRMNRPRIPPTPNTM